MTSVAQPKVYRLKDKHDDVEFTGVQLGFATTETPDATRWTEIVIYRTEAGQYVIHRIGRSVLYHDPEGECNTGVLTACMDITDDDEFDALQPCDQCAPVDPDDLDNETMIMRELDRYNVDVCPATEVATKLKLRRTDGTEFISQVASRALAEAMGADAELRDSVAVRKIS